MYREVQEGGGWAKPERMGESRRAEELAGWGFEAGGTKESERVFEAYAEAASIPNQVVPVLSLARRSFRLGLFEPLLTSDPDSGTRFGKLGQALEALQTQLDKHENREAVVALADMLPVIGIKPSHPFRQHVDGVKEKIPVV
jgi:hypothetical protein